MLPSPPNTRNQPLKREPSESVLTQRKSSRRAAATYQEAVFGGAPELAQLLPHAPLEQLLAGGGEDGLEAAGVTVRRVHRGGGFQNPSPRNPRSSPKQSRGRFQAGFQISAGNRRFSGFFSIPGPVRDGKPGLVFYILCF